MTDGTTTAGRLANGTTTAGRLAGRIALITGASRGIGAAVARRFAAEGAHLVLTARTSGALEELDDDIQALGGQATLVPLDLTQFDAIDQMGAALYERFGRLDILVGNAGLLRPLSPMHHVQPKDWQATLDLNLTANYRLIRAMDPLLRQSDAGRAIFVSSTVTQGVWPFWGAYAVSKAGLEAMVRTYAAEVEKTSLRVNLLNPGPTYTRLRTVAYPGENPDDLKKPDDVAGLFVDLAEPACTRNGDLITAPRHP
ncbi:MAG: SDR family NAD(P)-dependent oxidoreductase [Rhodobacterales bacterium]|nr:SDR family NAD(P)-dependent oxidoreductase [Rhodobacterales bacterium]